MALLHDSDEDEHQVERTLTQRLWSHGGLQDEEVGSVGGTLSSLGPPIGAGGAYFNTVCVMLGVGVFGLPATIAKGGWVMMGVMPLLIAMACFTARLLIDLLYCDFAADGVRLLGYPEVGGRVFGKAGLVLTHFLMKITVFTVCSVMAYLSSQMSRDFYLTCKYGHDSAAHDSKESLRHCVIIICSAAAIPIVLLPTLKEVSVLSLAGSIATFVVIAVTIGCVLSDIPSDAPPYDAVNPSKLGDGFGTLTLGLGGAATMPSFEAQMYTGRRAARPYKSVLLKVFGTLVALYVPIAGVGYGVYGKNVTPLIIDALPTHGGFIIVIGTVRFVLGLNCFVTLILANFVLSEEFERHLFEIDPTALTIRDHLCSRHSFPRALVRVGVLACSAALAYLVPNFLALCDLTGSICVFCVFLLPCTYTLALDYQRVKEGMPGQGWGKRTVLILVMLVSCTGFFFGFKSAVKEVHDAF
eukprot:Hpha_TRINITY_DN9254_c0_g1::TRINITY_DN9254_c0_g1_i1::g.28649::m.28649/K15015/SLC32A, VGAT; solute carrier family 32 (vesicular inhibitory amino acid transporter)